MSIRLQGWTCNGQHKTARPDILNFLKKQENAEGFGNGRIFSNKIQDKAAFTISHLFDVRETEGNSRTDQNQAMDEIKSSDLTHPVALSNPIGVKKTRLANAAAGWSTQDLQLSLKPRSVEDGVAVALGAEEVNSPTALSLSLSLNCPSSPSMKLHEENKRGMHFLQAGSSGKKACLGLTTLDLTMSIKASE